jgi:tetratricopeptide (TPR) repeat protein
LREVAAGIGANCFRLDTVNKVGYRLISLDSPLDAAAANATEMPVVPPRRRHLQLALAGASFALAGLVALIAWTRAPASGITTIALVSQGHGAAELADGLVADLARLANAGGNTFVFSSGQKSGRADYLLKIAQPRSNTGPRADVTFLKDGSPEVLWSATFAQHGRDPASLRLQIANAVFQVAGCALETNNDPRQSDSETLRLVFSGCERFEADPDNTTVELWRQVIGRNPKNARALANLAFAEALWADFGSELTETAPSTALLAAARTHLRQARALEPSQGLTYAAEVVLLPHGHYADQLKHLDLGLAADPNCADLYALKTQTLQNVGRMDDALDGARKAVELQPSSATHRMQLILAFAYAGYPQSAKAELETAERIWPDSPVIRDARLAFDFRFGDPHEQLRRIDRGEALQPYASIHVQNGLERSFLLARADPTPANIEAAAKLTFSFRHAPYVAMPSLVGLGRLDMAYDYVADPAIVAQFREGGTNVLFRVYMKSFLFDRRFMGFADKIGLVRYWQRSRAWPDFCRDKDVPYDCKAEAQRLHPAKAV